MLVLDPFGPLIHKLMGLSSPKLISAFVLWYWTFSKISEINSLKLQVIVRKQNVSLEDMADNDADYDIIPLYDPKTFVGGRIKTLQWHIALYTYIIWHLLDSWLFGNYIHTTSYYLYMILFYFLYKKLKNSIYRNILAFFIFVIILLGLTGAHYIPKVINFHISFVETSTTNSKQVTRIKISINAIIFITC